MLDEEVAPRIAARLGRSQVVRARLLRTFGIGESNLDRILDDLARGDAGTVLGFRTQFPDNLVRILVRAPDASADEIGQLGSAFNSMLARLTDLKVAEIETARELEAMQRELKLKAELERQHEIVEATTR